MIPVLPDLLATCTDIATTFRLHARLAYQAGDQQRGDRLTAWGLLWEAAAAADELPALPVVHP